MSTTEAQVGASQPQEAVEAGSARAFAVLLVCVAVVGLLPVTLDALLYGRPEENLLVGRGLTGLSDRVYRIGELGMLVLAVGYLLGSGRARRHGLGIFAVVLTGWAMLALLDGGGRKVDLLAPFVILLAVVRASLDAPSDAVVAVVRRITVAISLGSLALLVLQPQAACFGARRFPALSVALPAPCDSSRLAGITNHPNSLGLLATVGAVLCLLAPGRAWRRSSLAACLVAAFATESRGSLGAGLAALCVVGLLTVRKERRSTALQRLALVATLLAATVWAGGWLSPQVGSSATPGTLNGRTIIWNFVLAHWRERPLTGHGSFSFAAAVTETSALPAYAGQAHGQFFQSLYTQGAIGLVLVVALLLVLSFRTFRTLPAVRPVAMAMLTVLFIRCIPESPFALTGTGFDLLLLCLILPTLSLRSVARGPL